MRLFLSLNPPPIMFYRVIENFPNKIREISFNSWSLSPYIKKLFKNSCIKIHLLFSNFATSNFVCRATSGFTEIESILF